LTIKQKGVKMDRLKVEHHIKHLQEKHDELDKRLKPDTPDFISRVIKKEKLHLKDEIERLKIKIQ
jgi:hypothetical protein